MSYFLGNDGWSFIRTFILERAVPLILVLTGVGCNAFSFVDTPSGDAQNLSAARACFDQGNFVCASKYYSLLSAASSDEANSEQAFEILAQNGVTVGVFISAAEAGSSSGGVLITKIADALTPIASQTTRLGIFHAYQKTALVVDGKTQGLIRFITSTALTAELFAEAARTSGKLAQTDLVTNPTTCEASKPTFLSPGCYAPSGSKLITGTSVSIPSATDTQMSGSPTLYMINSAINEIANGITQMGANGSLGSSSSNFSSSVISVAGTTLIGGTGDSPIYRGTLIDLNVGEQ